MEPNRNSATALAAVLQDLAKIEQDIREINDKIREQDKRQKLFDEEEKTPKSCFLLARNKIRAWRANR